LRTLHEELARRDDVVIGVGNIGIIAVPPGWWLNMRLMWLLLQLLLLSALVLVLFLLLLILIDQVQKSRMLLSQI
jgi:hypothetical protein